MDKPPRTDSIGWIESSFYVAMLVLGLGSIMGAWAFIVPAGLVLGAIVYGCFRDAVLLSRAKTQGKPSRGLSEEEGSTVTRPRRS
jgi:hypothetical protein